MVEHESDRACSRFADTVYFHLPPLSGDMKCVYGVSCYRQIESKVSFIYIFCLICAFELKKVHFADHS